MTDLESRRDPESVDDEADEVGNGKSIEDRAAEGEAEEPEDDGTPQLVLPGTGTKLSGTIGGKKPTESAFKMSSISLPISGNVQLNKDDELWIAMKVAVDKVEHKNRRKGREIAAVVRTHTAVPISAPFILDESPVDET